MDISNKIDAILLVVHGSVLPDAARAYEHLQTRFSAAFAPVPIRLAITSKRVGSKLAEQGRAIPLVSEALTALQTEGFKHIAIQSTHVTAAELFEKMREIAIDLIPAVIIGRPMLGREDDIKSFADAIIAILPPERRPDDAVMLMGHGRIDGIADPLYLALARELQTRDPHIFLSNLVGSLDFASRRREVNTAGLRRVWLQSLLLAVGFHVEYDMFGNHAGSLSSQLTDDGIEVIPVRKGLGEYDTIAELLIHHLREAVAASDNTGKP